MDTSHIYSFSDFCGLQTIVPSETPLATPIKRGPGWPKKPKSNRGSGSPREGESEEFNQSETAQTLLDPLSGVIKRFEMQPPTIYHEAYHYVWPDTQQMATNELIRSMQWDQAKSSSTTIVDQLRTQLDVDRRMYVLAEAHLLQAQCEAANMRRQQQQQMSSLNNGQKSVDQNVKSEKSKSRRRGRSVVPQFIPQLEGEHCENDRNKFHRSHPSADMSPLTYEISGLDSGNNDSSDDSNDNSSEDECKEPEKEGKDIVMYDYFGYGPEDDF
jgi:hypothetical protein